MTTRVTFKSLREGAHRPSFSRFTRGIQRWSNFPEYGWTVRCACGWELRHNGPKSEAIEHHTDHLREIQDERSS